jgi:hypothetical protein
MTSTQSLDDQVNESIKFLLDARVENIGKVRFGEESRKYFDNGIYMISGLLHYTMEFPQMSDRICSDYLGAVNFKLNPPTKEKFDETLQTITGSTSAKTEAIVLMLLAFRKHIPKKGRYKTGYKKLYDKGINTFIKSIIQHYDDDNLGQILDAYNNAIAKNHDLI